MYSSTFARGSTTPAALARWLVPTQIRPQECVVPPPSLGWFSSSKVLRPRRCAASAVDRPAMPEPSTITSNTSSR